MTYPEAASIPLALSPKCRIGPPLRTLATLPFTYAVLPAFSDFSVADIFANEKAALASLAALRESAAQREQRRTELDAKRTQAALDERNRRAPGFSGEVGRVLVPVRANAGSEEAADDAADAVARLDIA
ncbi:hypothetical protein HDU98_004003 [Podochytrium sp. JEL0797]|nr:hypothetical protein HDU98_004003 [Podochytrium sp. JEL0797]